MTDPNIEKYKNLLQHTRNLILHGAPGTGKTYLARQIAQAMGAETGFVQFHPSYDYTDFVEGIRPKCKMASDSADFELVDGTFKKFCVRALQNLIESEKSASEIEKETSIDENINTFISDAIEENTEFEIATGNKFFITDMTDKSIFVSIPANEKTSELALSKKELKDLLSSDEKIENGNDIREFFNRKWRTQQDSYMLVLYKKLLVTKAQKEFTSEIVSFDEAYGLLIKDLKESGETLTFSRPRSASFKVSVGNDSILRIDGVSVKKDLVESFYNKTNTTHWYEIHCKQIINYMQEKYGLGRQTATVNTVADYSEGTNETETKQKPFVFIIDEINRGEMSKILGELFFAIDPDYRGAKNCSHLVTQYANMQTEPNIFDSVLGERQNFGHFFVPENVYIIGTMNDIDRSVESMDLAMRRRFAFEEITAEQSRDTMLTKANKKLLPFDDETIEALRTKMTNLNDALVSGDIALPSAYQIGAAYFLKFAGYKSDNASDDDAFDSLWNYNLEPLLREYLRGQDSSGEKLKILKAAYDKTTLTNAQDKSEPND